MRTAKIFALSIMINLILLWLFVEFVMKPINQFAKAIAEGLLR